MPATTATQAGGPVQSISPKKEVSRPPPPSKSTAAATNADSNSHSSNPPPNATAKGSRRAQGWHSAVGGGGTASNASSNNGIRETHSNLDGRGLAHSRGNSGMPRRSSVQFSEDAMDNTPTPRAASKPRATAAGAANKDDAAFRQSMADFLTVMYGERTATGGAEKSAAGSSSGAKNNSVGGGGKERGGGLTGSGSSGLGKSDIPRAQRSGSPHLPPSGVKGPLVKGLTATGSRHGTGDRIDTLVDTLVRAYSRQATSSRGDFHGASGGPEDDAAVSYNRPRHQNYRRAVASPRLGRGSGAGSGHSGVDTNEVSLFVSQAMDSFIGPGGLRQQGLPSTRSVLSSLGVDRNMFGLMSFQTKSNMQEVDTVEDASDTKLEPMYVGEQALFHSVGTRPNMNDVSISKSMRGVIPAPGELDEEWKKDSGRANGSPQRRISSGAGRAGRMNSSNLSLDSGVQAGKRDSNGSQPHDGSPAGPRAAARRFSSDNHNNNNKSVTRCMSLDSKALGAAAGGGGADKDEDDSWGNDAGAGVPAPPAPPATTSNGTAVVSSARSLLDYAKSRQHAAALEQALADLFEEEQLKRDVVAAVERQLRGYIVSLQTEERDRGAKTGRGASGGNSSSGRTTSGDGGRSQRGSNAGSSGNSSNTNTTSHNNTVSSAASPPMKNTVDFFEKRSSPTPATETVKRLPR